MYDFYVPKFVILKISDGQSVKVWQDLVKKVSRICAGGSIVI
jgi:hypothetical protein